MNGPQWNCGWDIDHLEEQICASQLHGIFCVQSTGVIFSMVIVNCAISGPFPESDEFLQLQGLTTMYWQTGDLTGTLPARWALLSSLHTLVLANQPLSGTLPAAWATMTSLQVLQITSHRLEGEIPREWFRSANLNPSYNPLPNLNLLHMVPQTSNTIVNFRLRLIDDDGNIRLPPMNCASFSMEYTPIVAPDQAQGVAQLPAQWWATNLTTLTLNNCGLSGTLPSEWAASNIQYLYLNNNQITGTIPLSWVLNGSSLLQWSLNGNRLVGGLPSLDILSTAVVEITLLRNPFTAPVTFRQQLAGRYSTNLKYVYLQSNQLNGTIPVDWFWGMPQMILFELSYNQLTGPLPPLPGIAVRNPIGGVNTTYELYRNGGPRAGWTISSALILSPHGNLLTGTILTLFQFVGALELQNNPPAPAQRPWAELPGTLGTLDRIRR